MLSTVEGQENLPRPEEERITQAEKNKKMQDQLKVRQIFLHCIIAHQITAGDASKH